MEKVPNGPVGMLTVEQLAEVKLMADSQKTHVAQVQEAFIAAIQKDGMSHSFRWLDKWYGLLAEAEVKDELKNQLAEHANDPVAVELYLRDSLMSHASGVSNKSTSVSSNFMKECVVEATARMLRNGAGRRKLSGDWEAWRAELPAATPKD